MIDIANEKTVSLKDAASSLPTGRLGRPVGLSTIFRWIFDGVRTPNGIVRLEALKLGGRYITSIEALQRFADAQTPELDGREAAPRSPTRRAQAAKKAGEQLSKIGV